MSGANEPALRQTNEELRVLYDESAEGIIIADLQSKAFRRVNRSICRMLGYTEEEMLSLSVEDIHPADNMSHVLAAFKAASERRLKCIRDIPCLRKDGALVYADISAAHLKYQDRDCLLSFFHDITERKWTIELLRASDDRYRTIANNVADVIWTVEFPTEILKQRWGEAAPAELTDAVLNHWRFSYVSPAAERVFGYTPEESKNLSLHDLVAPEAIARARNALIEDFSWDASQPADAYQKRFLEVECRAKDGSHRWCEIVGTYMRDEDGVPTGLLGITRDVTEHRRAERALRESEATLRGLFENLPDLVMMLDQNANIQFINRAQSGISRE
ncbi:MAG: PAS domain S-box protein, partial [Pirellulales bacterium]|nr:PAS domain S-box protein [Pirellulales bacterium]